VIDHCSGCDVLVHEVYTMKGHAAAAPSWQAYLLQEMRHAYKGHFVSGLDLDFY